MLRLRPLSGRACAPLPTRDAARAMLKGLHVQDFHPLTGGQYARWGHLGRVGCRWEARA